jgi:hypothetical protein
MSPHFIKSCDKPAAYWRPYPFVRLVPASLPGLSRVGWLHRRAPTCFEGLEVTVTAAKDRTIAHTPASLRGKAEEFLRLAAAAHDPVAWHELQLLAASYLQRARELEGSTAAGAGTDLGERAG